MSKKILVLITSLILINNIFAINIYDEYQNARKFYFEKDYTKAAFSLEKVLNEVPDYEEAKLLYFKVRYETGERFKVRHQLFAHPCEQGFTQLVLVEQPTELEHRRRVLSDLRQRRRKVHGLGRQRKDVRGNGLDD